jgi:hypothetical protein
LTRTSRRRSPRTTRSLELQRPGRTDLLSEPAGARPSVELLGNWLRSTPGSSATGRRQPRSASWPVHGHSSSPTVSTEPPACPKSGPLGRRLLLQPPKPRYLKAPQLLALGASSTTTIERIQIPARLSVTGFDDTPQAASATPPLTAVHQNLQGMGAMAVQAILDMHACS